MAGGDGGPIRTVLLAAVIAAAAAFAISTSHDFSKQRIAANRRARLIASSGQRPSSWTSAMLSRQKPVAKTARGSLLFCIVEAAGGCGGGEELVTMALEV